MPWYSFLQPFLDLVCPPHCIFCMEPLGEEPHVSHLCGDCRTKFTTPQSRYCRRCGGKRFVEEEQIHIDASKQEVEPKHLFSCARCRGTKFLFTHCISLGEYEAELRSAILRTKKDRSGALAIALARLLCEERLDALREFEPDLIVPVPMHYIRRFVRGLNAPDIIAGEVAKKLGIPCVKRKVRRTKATKLQRSLTPVERRGNLKEAFGVNKKDRSFDGKKVLLIDDVMTSGSTCNAVAKVLLDAGAKSVLLLVLARAEGTKHPGA